MCSAPKPPPVVARDPIAEAAAAANDAAGKANSELAFRRKQRRMNSLFTGSRAGVTTRGPSLMAQAYAKPTLG